MNYRQQYRPILFLLAVALTACSSTQEAYIQNFKFYSAGQQNVELTDQEVIDSVYDLIYVKNGDRPYATMALAFIENGQYKWLSQDNVMFITDTGRLIRTLGLSENLSHVSNIDSDFLKNWYEKKALRPTWKRKIDTQLEGIDDYGSSLSSTAHVNEAVEIEIQNKRFSTYHIVETVKHQSALYGESMWENEFWFDSKTQQLLKSTQSISPQMERIEIIYVSRAMRLTPSLKEEKMLSSRGVGE